MILLLCQFFTKKIKSTVYLKGLIEDSGSCFLKLVKLRILCNNIINK